ncbi:hypothetical protein B0H10DRAFT_1998865, partial [Mycena sp. CBHHK59/15]
MMALKAKNARQGMKTMGLCPSHQRSSRWGGSPCRPLVRRQCCAKLKSLPCPRPLRTCSAASLNHLRSSALSMRNQLFPLGSSDSRGRTAAAIVTSKRPRPTTTSSPPPTKRLKLAAQEAKFAEGYTPVAGVKPKASDYTPIPQALILRACADYSARILTVDAFPGVAVQVRWAKETFKGTCHGAKERYILTDRMAKIIMARGSQARGKMLDAYRSLFASHYGFERSSATKNIKANKLKVEKHLEKAAFHYK